MENRHYPLLEGGVGEPIKQMERYLRFGEAGEVKLLLQQAFDLPRCAHFKGNVPFFVGRSDPSFEEGIVPVLTLLMPWITVRSRYAKLSVSGGHYHSPP